MPPTCGGRDCSKGYRVWDLGLRVQDVELVEVKLSAAHVQSSWRDFERSFLMPMPWVHCTNSVYPWLESFDHVSPHGAFLKRQQSSACAGPFLG